MKKTVKILVSYIILTTFSLTSLVSPRASAQGMPFLPKPGVMVSLSPVFTPPLVKAITIHTDNPLAFDFLIDQGDVKLAQEDKQEEYQKLIKYFLAALAIPENELWVNLSPYEKQRIIPETFGKTEMGRDLLAMDYVLKQITASLIYPEEGLGKEFWDRIYKEAHEKFGTTTVPVNTFNKVWIVPDVAEVYEKGNTVFLIKSHLKVMLEEDYLSMDKHNGIVIVSPEGAKQSKDVNKLGSQIVREVILPALEKEVNEGKNFALLRQINDSLILATWYKKALKDSLLGKVYANKGKVKGVEYESSVILSPKGTKDLNKSNDSSATPQNDVDAIYQQYLKAFKKGVFNYIKEDVDRYSQEMIPRKYFSGGYSTTIVGLNGMVTSLAQRVELVSREAAMASFAMIESSKLGNLDRAEVAVNEQNTPAMNSEWTAAKAYVTNPANRRGFLKVAGAGVLGWVLFRPSSKKEEKPVTPAPVVNLGGVFDPNPRMGGTFTVRLDDARSTLIIIPNEIFSPKGIESWWPGPEGLELQASAKTLWERLTAIDAEAKYLGDEKAKAEQQLSSNPTNLEYKRKILLFEIGIRKLQYEGEIKSPRFLIWLRNSLGKYAAALSRRGSVDLRASDPQSFVSGTRDSLVTHLQQMEDYKRGSLITLHNPEIATRLNLLNKYIDAIFNSATLLVARSDWDGQKFYLDEMLKLFAEMKGLVSKIEGYRNLLDRYKPENTKGFFVFMDQGFSYDFSPWVSKNNIMFLAAQEVLSGGAKAGKQRIANQIRKIQTEAKRLKKQNQAMSSELSSAQPSAAMVYNDVSSRLEGMIERVKNGLRAERNFSKVARDVQEIFGTAPLGWIPLGEALLGIILADDRRRDMNLEKPDVRIILRAITQEKVRIGTREVKLAFVESNDDGWKAGVRYRLWDPFNYNMSRNDRIALMEALQERLETMLKEWGVLVQEKPFAVEYMYTQHRLEISVGEKYSEEELAQVFLGLCASKGDTKALNVLAIKIAGNRLAKVQKAITGNVSDAVKVELSKAIGAVDTLRNENNPQTQIYILRDAMHALDIKIEGSRPTSPVDEIQALEGINAILTELHRLITYKAPEQVADLASRASVNPPPAMATVENRISWEEVSGFIGGGIADDIRLSFFALMSGDKEMLKAPITVEQATIIYSKLVENEGKKDSKSFLISEMEDDIKDPSIPLEHRKVLFEALNVLKANLRQSITLNKALGQVQKSIDLKLGEDVFISAGKFSYRLWVDEEARQVFFQRHLRDEGDGKLRFWADGGVRNVSKEIAEKVRQSAGREIVDTFNVGSFENEEKDKYKALKGNDYVVPKYNGGELNDFQFSLRLSPTQDVDGGYRVTIVDQQDKGTGKVISPETKIYWQVPSGVVVGESEVSQGSNLSGEAVLDAGVASVREDALVSRASTSKRESDSAVEYKFKNEISREIFGEANEVPIRLQSPEYVKVAMGDRVVSFTKENGGYLVRDIGLSVEGIARPEDVTLKVGEGNGVILGRGSNSFPGYGMDSDLSRKQAKVTLNEKGVLVFENLGTALKRTAVTAEGEDFVDPASTSPADVGGIDLNPAMQTLQIKRDGAGVPLPISQQNIDLINLEGLFPVIKSITPAINSPIYSEIFTAAANSKSS